MNAALVKYDPGLHPNHRKYWKTSDIKYLKDYYKKDSLANIAAALGRTYKTVAHMVYRLKQKGEL